MIPSYKDKLALNLKKAQGQLARIAKMVEEDRYCIDIAQQVNAGIGLLKGMNATILESHLNSCGGHDLNSKDDKVREKFIKELLQVCSITTK